MEKLNWEETLKARYEYEQARQARIQKVPCSYCTKPVPTRDRQAGDLPPSADEIGVHLEDGRHFHTDCYQVYLIEKCSREGE